MRRLTASRAWAAVAVVAAIVAVLAVMFPGLGFGQTTSSHGGMPSEVFMQTHVLPRASDRSDPDLARRGHHRSVPTLSSRAR